MTSVMKSEGNGSNSADGKLLKLLHKKVGGLKRKKNGHFEDMRKMIRKLH